MFTLVFGVTIFTLSVITGLVCLLSPDTVIRQDPDCANVDPEMARRNTRIGGAVIILIGLSGIWAVLTGTGPGDP